MYLLEDPLLPYLLPSAVLLGAGEPYLLPLPCLEAPYLAVLPSVSAAPLDVYLLEEPEEPEVVLAL